MDTKKCGKCKRVLPTSCFYKNRKSKDGLQYHCKDCVKAYKTEGNYDAKYYETHKDQVKKGNSTKGTPADSRQRLEHRQDYEKNKTARLAQQKAYRQENWPAQYIATRDKRINIHGPARRARLASAFDESVDRRVVWGRDEGHCRIKLVCDGVFVPFEKMHMDHVIPLSEGGRHNYGNVQTGCPPCNLAKGPLVLERT